MPHSVVLLSEREGCKQTTFTKIEMKNVFLAHFSVIPFHSRRFQCKKHGISDFWDRSGLLSSKAGKSGNSRLISRFWGFSASLNAPVCARFCHFCLMSRQQSPTHVARWNNKTINTCKVHTSRSLFMHHNLDDLIFEAIHLIKAFPFFEFMSSRTYDPGFRFFANQKKREISSPCVGLRLAYTTCYTTLH